MPIEHINPPTLHAPVDNTYAHIVSSTGRVTYRIGGQVAFDVDGNNVAVGNMAGQIRACYEYATAALQAVNLTSRDVTHIYTFTMDMDEYMRHEQAIARDYFGEWPPASTLVEVARLVDRDWLVEVQVDTVGQ